MNHKEFRIEVFKKAALCRHFENKVYKLVEKKIIKIPVYLSAGQEYISASLASIIQSSKNKPLLFPQHRCHSIYLSFGGNIIGLIDSFDSGEYFFNDSDVKNLNIKSKNIFRNKFIGFIHQFFHLIPELTVIENVALPKMISGKNTIKS